ncbi:MAG: hypothetical protein GTO14_17570 [Anaerolineales bacterium]|nr:hypothetical protein [Anaerolineales bacterium]
MAAGTRVRVYSGAPIGAPTPEAGMEQRFVAATGSAGMMILPSNGVELRLLSPLEEVLHQRWFLPGKAYAAVTTKVLRKRDGTAFFLFVPTASPTGTSLTRCGYRLKLTYRRDNQTVDKKSIVLRQSGSKADEVVIIDLPWDSAKAQEAGA